MLRFEPSPRGPARVLGLALAAGALLLGSAPTSLAGPPPGVRPDPRMMSGIPRVDPELPAGMITVRCLLGSFDRPASGVSVSLELRSADGAQTETRTAEVAEQGRAIFRELTAFVGGTAIAEVDFEGERVRSRPIPLDARAGSRVMLVAGASEVGSAPAHGADAPAAAGDGHGSSGDVPMPGQPFADERFPAGQVIVGTLDLDAGTPIEGAEVILRGTVDDSPVILRGRSDAQGRTKFTDLFAEHPPDTRWVAEAAIGEGGAPLRSQPFTLEQERGTAVVLARGGEAHAAAPARARRRSLPGPHRLTDEPPGTVRITVVDAADRPAGAVPVVVQREAVTGARERVEGVTGEDGVARLQIRISGDSLYRVRAEHDGAPFRSTDFGMDERSGVGVVLRVFEVTGDLSRVQGEAQFSFVGREQERVQVAQRFQVFVSGDEAFWPGEGFRLEGAEGAVGTVVMNTAAPLLAHRDKSPYAELAGPIPPGEIVDLSLAYLLEHDGEATLRWTAPVKLVQVSAVLDPELTMVRGHRGPPVRPPVQHGQAPIDLYELGEAGPGQTIEIAVGGLPVDELARWMRWLGVGFALSLLLGLAAVLFAGMRTGVRRRLLARRDALLTALDAVEAEGAIREPGVERGGAARRPGAAARRRVIIAALDSVYRQLDDHGGVPADERPG